MKKKLILIGALVVVAVLVLLVVGLSNLGPIIKKAVNTYGPQLTKTDVHLGDVNVSLLSGKATLKDLLVGSPKGFSAPQTLKVGSISVKLDEKSLARDTIVIDRIEVLRPEITYERAHGTDNLKTILNNLTSAGGSAQPTKKEPAKGPGKKLFIKDFIARDAKVDLVVPGSGGRSATASLSEIHLKDVGKTSSGATPAEVFAEIFSKLYQSVTSPAVTDALNRELKAVGGTAQSAAEGVKKEAGGLGEKLKGVLGK
jgi:uncharacterized protein involved in outer membrane biogenesis